MEHPEYAWPSWKFGMKREDLFTKLHDKYNTFSSTIQDPDAFHHDVYEITNEACTEDDFHRLMLERKQQRLQELNESLESAAVEIIANPKLIGTEQWSFALQLFRTRSLDSLVRYFSSYLPEGYPVDRRDHDASSTTSSVNDRWSTVSASTDVSSVDSDVDADGPLLFPENGDDAIATGKPPTRQQTLRVSTTSTVVVSHDMPLSPESTSARSDPDDRFMKPSQGHERHHHHDFFSREALTPARSLSFSGSDSDGGFCRDRHLMSDSDDASHAGGLDSEATSVSDMSEAHTHDPDLEQKYPLRDESAIADDYDEDDFECAQFPDDIFDTICDSIESDTPTPKPDSINNDAASTYLDAKLTPRACSALSPYRELAPKHHASRTQRNGSPMRASRRSPEEASCRISKPLPDTARTRNIQGRRRGLD